ASPAEEIRVVTLGRNQTLGELLQGAVEDTEHYALLLAFREQASPRRMREGTEITLRYLPAGQGLRGVDVAIDSDRTVRLMRDMAGWMSETIETPTYVDTLFVSGQIETVLWTAVVRNPALEGIPVEDRNRLIDYLDRVFQWQVDFSRQIRVGDTYRVAFEREVRPDGSMRAGRILAAELVNSGTAYHAVWFDPNGDGEGSWYDLDGNSVRRAFLLKPLEYRRISSRFSNGRFHPVLKRWRAHRGIDYAADAGTPVMATSDGVVIHRGPKGSFGNTVEIRHPNGFVTRYGHLQGFRRGVNLGTRVHQSDVIGYVGMTGLATGPHLHYEMLRGGQQMNPLSVDIPAGDPVPTEDRDRWLDEMTVRVALLDLVPGAGPVRTAVADADVDGEDGLDADPDDAGG
ncbi:MAG TPA: M23 family metallopeptidase, partial [Longimicrobiales bacterium]|nr:M23 family metallopeptidase [Longimicrobiales bacterium]